jgi:hypothetical protein
MTTRPDARPMLIALLLALGCGRREAGSPIDPTAVADAGEPQGTASRDELSILPSSMADHRIGPSRWTSVISTGWLRFPEWEEERSRDGRSYARVTGARHGTSALTLRVRTDACVCDPHMGDSVELPTCFDEPECNDVRLARTATRVYELDISQVCIEESDGDLGCSFGPDEVPTLPRVEGCEAVALFDTSRARTVDCYTIHYWPTSYKLPSQR